MPIWVNLYIAIMIASLPMGILLLRRIEQDWLHPVGGLLSTLLSVAFVISYWQPHVLPLQTNSTLLMFGFVLFWDFYSVVRVRRKMAQYLGITDDMEAPPSGAVWLMGLVLMLPAYFFGAMVCLRIISE